jgi:stage II sporulation protein P
MLKKENIKKKEYVNFLLNSSYDNNPNYKFLLNESIKLLNNGTLNEDKSDKKYTKEVFKEEEAYNHSDYEKVTSYINNTTTNLDNPILYLYNTHQLETYSNEGIENTTITPNVMMASYLLKDKLQSNNISTIVEDTNMAEFIKNTGVTNNQYYGSSRIFMQNAMKKYSSLKFFIDIHRDSISKNLSTIQIGDKSYAKVLFVIGTSNASYEKNEIVAKKISDKINEKYPNLSRGIFKRYVKDWPEAYNQDLSSNSLLIELGAKENNIKEVINTVNVLSEILSEYIKENK